MPLISSQPVDVGSSGPLQHNDLPACYSSAIGKGTAKTSLHENGGHLAAIERVLFQRCTDLDCHNTAVTHIGQAARVIPASLYPTIDMLFCLVSQHCGEIAAGMPCNPRVSICCHIAVESFKATETDSEAPVWRAWTRPVEGPCCRA
jgi:hypothetical protein